MKKRKKATSPTSARSARMARPSIGSDTGAKGRDRAAGKRATRRPQAAEACCFSLQAECLVGTAPALKSGLAEFLDEGAPITLDGSALQRVDAASMQVLAAFVRDRHARGLAVEWRDASPTLSAAARLLGLTSVLRLPA